MVFVAGTGTEAHRRQGRVSATLLAFPKMDAGAPTVPSIFQAEEKQEGTGAKLTQVSLVTFFWPELCPQPCLTSGEARDYRFLAGTLLPPTK